LAFTVAFRQGAGVKTVTELLQALVRTPSVNPEGTPGTPHVGEQACAEMVAAFLRESGAEVEVREVLPGRPNVIGTWPADRAGKPALIFAPHTDTVSVAGMTIDPFGGEVRDGRIWGRGASDTKGPMAAMLWALRERRDTLAGLSHQVIFTALCSEEAGQYGVKAYVDEEAAALRTRGAFAIVGEPTGLDAVVAHKGALWLSLTTRGRAVHAAEPERGENALYKMADLLRAIRDEIAPALATPVHPLLGRTTISAGTIAGGSKINIVPDFCQAEVDLRFLPGDDTLLERVSAQLRAVCPDVEIAHALSHPMQTDQDHSVIRILESCGARCVGAPWFSDAAIFAQAGIPAIACGPGSIAQAHTKDEWIAVSELERGVAFFEEILGRLKG
jgi:acetylornithine deacetylase/succinyl-diaminopimelate desuccinylase-like protein